ncbi:MAG: fibrobacter succinogenes major paralogous domain-containing protein [Chitinispirillaceae bacterium]|nr:fibrobacter succinogenes major paralogous domain-containing protein [Chitinispirillaceae bacterium]
MNRCWFFIAMLISAHVAIAKEGSVQDSTPVITVTDADGNLYHTVKIGNQVWTVENLRTTRFNDGTPVTHVTDDTAWDSMTTPAYCFYDNTTASKRKKKFGALYNWYAVNSGKLAPKGWHVPMDHEFDTLLVYLHTGKYMPRGYSVGKTLAAATDWIIDNSADGYVGSRTAKNNRSGFTALPGGLRDGLRGGFTAHNLFGWWWTASEVNNTSATACMLFYKSDSLNRKKKNKNCGLSVRLVKD